MVEKTGRSRVCLASRKVCQFFHVPLADLGGARPARAPPFAWHPSSLADLGGVRPARAPHLPGILVFDDILGHIV